MIKRDIVNFLKRFRKILEDDKHLAYIFELFILPLIKGAFSSKPSKRTIKSYDGKYRQEHYTSSFDDIRGEDFRTAMDHLFSVDKRTIEWYRVASKFRMKGTFVEGYKRLLPGYKLIQLRMGQYLLVRDDKALDYVEIEFDKSRDKANEDQIYRLTREEFASIRKHLLRVK